MANEIVVGLSNIVEGTPQLQLRPAGSTTFTLGHALVPVAPELAENEGIVGLSPRIVDYFGGATPLDTTEINLPVFGSPYDYSVSSVSLGTGDTRAEFWVINVLQNLDVNGQPATEGNEIFGFEWTYDVFNLDTFQTTTRTSQSGFFTIIDGDILGNPVNPGDVPEPPPPPPPPPTPVELAAQVLAGSPFGQYYYATNPDVAAVGIDPLTHYVQAGVFEGRAPFPFFDGNHYLSTNPDVAAAGVNPFVHFLLSGAAEGRDPGPWFDTAFYQQVNPDVAAAGVNPLLHYVQSGAAEGRLANELFNPAYYYAMNPDVAAAGVDALLHFVTAGLGEGRIALENFDPTLYQWLYPDVAAAGVNPLQHFMTAGYDEGRDPHPLFDTDFFESRNPDVAASPYPAFTHFNFAGVYEGRDPHPLIDISWYLEMNPDVAAAGVNPFTHFLQNGAFEGRDPSPFFDSSHYLSTYADVAAAGINPLVHYVLAGMAEGRTARGDDYSGDIATTGVVESFQDPSGSVFTRGTLDSPGDTDWFRIDRDRFDRISITEARVSEGFTTRPADADIDFGDLSFSIHDSRGRLLDDLGTPTQAFLGDILAYSEVDDPLDFFAFPDDFFFIEVSSDTGATGSYAFNTSTTDMAEFIGRRVDAEPFSFDLPAQGGLIVAPGDVGENSSYAGSLDSPFSGGSDFADGYRFTVAEARNVSIALTGHPTNELTLTGPPGFESISYNSGGVNARAMINANLAPGTYDVLVEGFEDYGIEFFW